ncbi:MAG: hypothetical protein ACHQQ3_05125 [Gemmatimonadales bacterium]
MDIVLHNHRASISDAMGRKVVRMVERAAARFPGSIRAVVRFGKDGSVCRVEVVLHSSRHAALVAVGEARYFGPASMQALARLGAQMRSGKRLRKARARRSAARDGQR